MDSIWAFLIQFTRKTFDIRQGELRRAFLMQLNIFLNISALLIVKPAVNSLFISKFGVESLPKVYLLVAIFAGAVTTFYGRQLAKKSLGRIFIFTTLISVLTLCFFGLLLVFNLIEDWVLYLFYIWMSIFAVLSASQFWILANVIFNSREAKRLFGFIGAGAIGGGIFGGYLTTLLAEWLGSENLLFVAALLLSICVPVTRKVWRDHLVYHPSTFQQKKRVPVIAQNPIKLILNSRHLTYIALIYGLSVLVAKIVEYQYSAVASDSIPDPDELTSFFGFWYSNFNVLSLLIQLFFTRRIVSTLGVGRALMFLPLFIALGAGFLFFFPVLWAAIFIRMADGSLKQSVNKAAMELLIMPISTEVKNQTKTFIDVFVDSVATGISGLILIFLVNGLDLSTRFISLIILVLIGLWAYFAYRVREEYLLSFKIKMGQKTTRPSGKKIDLKSAAVIQDLIKVLETGDEHQRIAALVKTRALPDPRLFEAIRLQLSHPSSDVKAEALRNLYFYKQPTLISEAEKLVQDASQKVKIEAFEYLIEHRPETMVPFMENYLNDSDERVRAAALISLAKETKDNPRLKTVFQLKKRIQKSLKNLENGQDTAKQKFDTIGVLKAIGYANIPAFDAVIGQYFEHPDLEIRKQAITSAGHTLDAQFIPSLIQFLKNDNLREAATTALANYGAGIIKELLAQAANPATDDEILKSLPEVLEKIGTQPSVDALFQLLNGQGHLVRLSALRTLNRLREQQPYLKFGHKRINTQLEREARRFKETYAIIFEQTLALKKQEPEAMRDARRELIALLQRRLGRNAERIFRLLALRYAAEDVLPVFEGLKSRQEEDQLNALDFLDNILDPANKKLLIPIVECIVHEDLSRSDLLNLGIPLPEDYTAYHTLLKRKDQKLQLLVLRLIRLSADEKYAPLVSEARFAKYPEVRAEAEGMVWEG